MMARWLDPEECTLIFACILPSSLSKSREAAQQRQGAQPCEIGPQRERRLPVEASMLTSPLALPS